MSAARVMIVEDERIVALNLQQRLVKLGYEVTARAASGQEALAKARETRPDLVLMDIHLEGTLDGIETAERLMEEQRLRVLYLTAYAEDSTLDRARRTRPYGYLVKPFSERELHATLQMALERQRADLALAESEERGRLALDAASMGSWEFARGRSELHTFGLAAELLADGSNDGVIGVERFLDCVDERDRDRVRQAVEQAAESGIPCSLEFRQLREGHPPRWLRVAARAYTPVGSHEPRLIGVAQDVSERHASEIRLRQAATVFDETREGIFILDAAHRLVSANHAFTQLTGIDPQLVAGRELPFLESHSLPGEPQALPWPSLEREGAWQGELRVSSARGDLFPGRVSLTRVRVPDTDLTQDVGILSDLTELRGAQEALRRLAHYDPLTGLPNRLLMHDRLDHALQRAHRNGSRVAVLFIDLDHFKRINDTRGHAVGDLVLKEAADRILSCVRKDDTAARLGGDEFLVIIETFQDTTHISAVAEKLRRAFVHPVVAGGHSFFVGASVGIALYPDDGNDVERLIQAADTAMYETKAGGRDGYTFFSPEMTTKVARYLARDQRLRRALADGELRLHYQPQIEMPRQHCGSVEALLRWQHPELGLLGADEIIPAAEESGLIVEIGRWALYEACRQGARWNRKGQPALRMALNVTAMQLRASNFLAQVRGALGEAGLAPHLLEIEITESALQTETAAITTLQALRSYGVSVAIDDFGTGYSCLASLKHLPLDRLKIDRGFITDLPSHGANLALVDSILDIARNMNLAVTAEGVETAAQRDFLYERGCSHMQGFLFGAPMDPDALTAHLSAHHVAA